MRLTSERGDVLLAYFAWAVEEHPGTSWVLAEFDATSRSPFGAQMRPHILLRNAVTELVAQSDQHRYVLEPVPTLVDPWRYWGIDNDSELPQERQLASYHAMLAGFIGTIAGGVASPIDLLAMAVRGSINQRLAISGFLAEATDGRIGVRGELPGADSIRVWARTAFDGLELPDRSERLADKYMTQLPGPYF